jgi:uncharacterized protein (DUF58 family)
MNPRSLPLLYPTRIALGLLFVVAVMWYASASQNNAANYLLLFTVVALCLVSIPHTLLNLTRLQVNVESIRPAFAGQEIAVPIEVENHSRTARNGIQLHLPVEGATPELIDEIPAGQAARVTLRFPVIARGEYQLHDLRLTSTYPLGFLGSSRRIPVQQRYIVYPEPAGTPNLPVVQVAISSSIAESRTGEGDDYAGVRAYVPGESQRHIDWKAVARGQPLMTKQFTAENDDVLQLNFSTLEGDTEQRLSQLTLWVIEAERARRRYALQLPSVAIPAGAGEPHYHRCLHALALFA